MPATLDSLLTGAKLSDDYAVLKHLGAGAFSEVKLCKSKATGELSAVKIINRSHPEFNEELLALEVEFMLRVKGHPNVVRIDGVYADRVSVYIVMEHMAGGELFDIIVKRVEHAKADDPRPYSEQHVAAIMYQITDAIVHCHSKLVAHRDLKPENMLIANNSDNDPSTPIKLADFGLSADISQDPLMHEPCGTPEYVAPEVVTQFKAGYNKSCDVWSLGVIMYILLCGYAPFWGKNASEILRRVKKGSVDYPSREWSHISKEGRDLLKSMLQLSPSARPTPTAILENPWMSGAAPVKALPDAIANLKIFNAKRKFRAGFEAIVAENRMEEAISGLRVEALTIELLNGETLDTVRELATAFAKKSGGAKLKKKDFSDVLCESFGIDEALASKHFDAFCVFKNSPTIEPHEYCQACVAVMDASSEEKINMAFELYDSDNSGVIDHDEFASLARNILIGQLNNEASLTAMIREEFEAADVDNDGKVSLEEWQKAAHGQERLRKYFKSISTLHVLQTSSRDVVKTRNALAKRGGKTGGAAADSGGGEEGGGCACAVM